ncbi:MAG: YidC/Oxa1 family membrane protein insertase [Armatimonadota bacterium]|jgi:YidC/Oxa1 family membrane protein insertase
MRRLWPLALLLILLPLLAGCFGPGAVALPLDQLSSIRDQFEELDNADRAAIDEKLTTLRQEVETEAESKDRAVQAEASRKRLLVAYCWERRGDFSDAETSYMQAARSPYGSVALFRTAQIGEYRAAKAAADAEDPNLESDRREEASQLAKLERQKAQKALEQVYNMSPESKVLLRDPSVASLPLSAWRTVNLRYEAYRRLDEYYREKPSYQAMAFLVKLCGGRQELAGKAKRSYPYVFAIVLIAVLAKLITTPLTAAQFRSMRKLQIVQPHLKKLQDKHKDDKQAMARAQMDLFKEHKVNPAGSCLPMLIQFPILIWVYYAIRYFVFQFEGVHFLYVKSLADPDVVTVSGMPVPGPLLILYGISMYFSQKLLAQPTAAPEQQQQQKMMAYMMPVLLLFVLKSLPAAFILYWLLQNMLMTGHQWLIMRPQRELAAAAESVTTVAESVGPPPEAIQKLSQGNGGGKKKKKRR